MQRVCVVGYGFAGRAFHSYLVGLAEGLVLDSIVSIVPSEVEAARRDRGVPVYSSVEDMLADRGADLAVLATPHNTHAPLAIQLLEAGVNVVTDKAMCLTVAEADAMMAASKRSGKLLSVFHNRRWDWDFNTLRKVISDGIIGEFLSVEIAVTHGRHGGWRGNPAVSGGLFYDWGSHMVDQALILGGSEPVEVYCRARKRDGMNEHGKLFITFANGFEASVEVGGGTGATIPKPHWHALGTLGSIRKYGVDPQEAAMKAGNIDAAEENPEEAMQVVVREDGGTRRVPVETVKTSWKSFYQNISDVLNGKGVEPAVKPEGVRTVIAVLEASEESMRTGRPVALGNRPA